MVIQGSTCRRVDDGSAWWTDRWLDGTAAESAARSQRGHERQVRAVGGVPLQPVTARHSTADEARTNDVSVKTAAPTDLAHR